MRLGRRIIGVIEALRASLEMKKVRFGTSCDGRNACNGSVKLRSTEYRAGMRSRHEAQAFGTAAVYCT
jgi:hypothetical protein